METMSNTQSIWTRIYSTLVGEVSADTLEAYRRASLAVYEQIDLVEAHRLESRANGLSPWTVPYSTQAEMLCAWNAFVLQTLGNEFLEADYTSDSATVGFVPRITADQVLAFYTQVEAWLTRARQAHVNPGYRLDLQVPADLPGWSKVEPCPNTHLAGMLKALSALSEHLEAPLQFLNDSPLPNTAAAQEHLNAIRSVHAIAQTKSRYAIDMFGSNPSRDVHERAEEHAKAAIENYYLLGQLLAMPQIADSLTVRKPLAQPILTDRDLFSLHPKLEPMITKLPGEPGFNPWCLTDPRSLSKLKLDKDAKLAIKRLWELDPDPTATLDLFAEIEEARRRGDIAFAKDENGEPQGYFFCCPWSPVYVVKRSLPLGGAVLRSLQTFVFDVTGEGMNLGAPFKREIKATAFKNTEKFEYGDPDEPPDH